MKKLKLDSGDEEMQDNADLKLEGGRLRVIAAFLTATQAFV